MPKGGSINMAEISKRCLQTLKEQIRRLAFMHNDPDDFQVVLMIVSIHRYLMDPDFTSQTGLECDDAETEVYDVIVSDFSNKMKCLLDPAFNFLVRKGELLAGSRVTLRLSDCTVYYNEMDLDADSLLIINKLAVVSTIERRINTDLIPNCGYPDDDNEDVPLVTSRNTYLSLWNDVDLYGKYVEEQVALGSGVRLQENTISISTLADNWKAITRPYPALLAKVIHKSRLRFYGKSNKFDKWPYQLYLTVGDGLAVCSVVLWNELALELHSSLTEGAVMRMAGYTVRHRFELMSHPTLRARNAREVDVEVSVNKHHPKADITLVDREDVRATWRLPSLQYHFLSRQHLSSLPDQYNVDIIGVVTFVGRVERTRRRVDSHQFWQYRWVELMDGTSHRPLRVELYATSQPQIHNALVPNMILVCTQMRVVHNLNEITSSHQQRALHVTTTNESQLCVDADDISDRYHSRVVKQLLQWSRSPEGQRAVKTAMSAGGYYCYPPVPTSLRGYQASFTGENPLTLVTGERLTTELSSLCCHEHRRLTIQGFLVHIRFVAPVSGKHRSLPRHEGYSLRSKKQNQEQKKKLRRKRRNECLENDAPNVDAVQPMSVLVDRAWSTAQGSVDTLVLTTAPPSFFRRYYLQKNKSAMSSCLCMPSSSYQHANMKTKLEDLPKHASPGHFIVTIIGLNHQVTLQALFPLPDRISHNATVTGLLSGLASEERTEAETSEPMPVVISSILDTAGHCHDKRMLFVLDLFRYRGNVVEVVLNRAFVVR